MQKRLQCYRCGADLSALSLPLSRSDLCPDCGMYLHACRMCVHFDRSVPKQCREDDAEEVMDKEKANFCDWFVPAPGRHVEADTAAASRARQQLDSLFGDGDESSDRPGDDDLQAKAEDLFR